jgi:hypothetical protein
MIWAIDWYPKILVHGDLNILNQPKFGIQFCMLYFRICYPKKCWLRMFTSPSLWETSTLRPHHDAAAKDIKITAQFRLVNYWNPAIYTYTHTYTYTYTYTYTQRMHACMDACKEMYIYIYIHIYIYVCIYIYAHCIYRYVQDASAIFSNKLGMLFSCNFIHLHTFLNMNESYNIFELEIIHLLSRNYIILYITIILS